MATVESVTTGSVDWVRVVRLAFLGAACSLALAAPADATNGTTTTTLTESRCAQPVSSGALPTATDCLFILNAAVGLQSCDCVCDPSGDGNSTATDALLCLSVAVGGPQTLMCPCGGTTTSSTSSTTNTSLPDTTTTTTTSTTTTTVSGPDAAAGQRDYDERCSFCHSAGSHDPTGDFGNLAGKGSALVMDLSTIDPFMDGLFLTQKQLEDMAAFLDGL